jgi:hypothetical protein
MIRIELSLRLANSPGALAGVCRLLSDERVNVQAMALETGGQLRLVVDNHVHAAAVLRDHHHQVAERNVIVTAGAGVRRARLRPRSLVGDTGVVQGIRLRRRRRAVQPRRSCFSASRTRNGRRPPRRLMKLYVETMDAVVVGDINADGRVRLQGEDWSQPTLQEQRAIIHAAQQELLALQELLEILQAPR